MSNYSNYYIDLPKQNFLYVKPDINVSNYFKDVQIHSWIELETTDFITVEAILWFLKQGFDIKPKIYLFCAVQNIVGPIHSDLCTYAFNFVVSGYGKMEWINPYNDSYNATKQYKDRESQYLRFSPHENDIILDSWDGEQGLVDVYTPHRIKTKEVKRYCLSLRTHYRKIKSFDDAVQTLLKNMS